MQNCCFKVRCIYICTIYDYKHHLLHILKDLESQTDECVTPQNGHKNAFAILDETSADTGSKEKRKSDSVEKSVMAYQEESSSTKKTKLEMLKEIKVEKP